ncbi:MAG: hypothetical protein IK017_04730 [Paludibacteraceae bacterium]|nr:hypothetical protein [Paludibacteraceae bacterium]
MKSMILVKGPSKRGKSQSIKRLATTFPFSSIIRPWTGNDYDSYIIGTALDEKGEERIVGMESLGDPWSCQKQWIEECINSGCEVVVAASRSYGQTVDDACGLAGSSGYEVIEVSTYFHVGSPKLLNGVDLRDAFAENMISLIRKCLK